MCLPTKYPKIVIKVIVSYVACINETYRNYWLQKLTDNPSFLGSEPPKSTPCSLSLTII